MSMSMSGYCGISSMLLISFNLTLSKFAKFGGGSFCAAIAAGTTGTIGEGGILLGPI